MTLSAAGLSYLGGIDPKTSTLCADVESQEEHDGMGNDFLWQTKQNARRLREVRTCEAD